MEYSSGIPQGSSLGPVLWNLYVNDVFDLDIGDFEIQAYAYDIVLYCRSKTAYRLEAKAASVLDELANWAETNKLQFNIAKCNTQ